MNNFLKLVIFGLFLIGVYTLFTVLYIPGVESERPPRMAMTLSELTPSRLASFGEEVYRDGGGCALCHEKVIGRAPPLEGIAVAGTERVKGDDYKGEATDAVGYIYESMFEPSVYVVSGYGKVKDGVVVSPMPTVAGGELGLTDLEVWAVIAYLQKAAGLEVSAEIMDRARENL